MFPAVLLAVLCGLSQITDAASTCSNGLIVTHHWVKHDRSCVDKRTNEYTKRKLGCYIETAPTARSPYRKEGEDLSLQQEIHWNVPETIDGLYGFNEHSPGGVVVCTDEKKFNIPDYCSRAMIAQLSYPYNGITRTPGVTVGGVALSFFKSRSPDGWFHRPLSELFDIRERETGVCWEFPYEYSSLYQEVYHRCELSKHDTEDLAIECCKKEFEDQMKSNFMKPFLELMEDNNFQDKFEAINSAAKRSREAALQKQQQDHEENSVEFSMELLRKLESDVQALAVQA